LGRSLSSCRVSRRCRDCRYRGGCGWDQGWSCGNWAECLTFCRDRRSRFCKIYRNRAGWSSRNRCCDCLIFRRGSAGGAGGMAAVAIGSGRVEVGTVGTVRALNTDGAGVGAAGTSRAWNASGSCTGPRRVSGVGRTGTGAGASGCCSGRAGGA
jgi:hypothetical protein